jgi:NAD(P)-dependent dehydrogenase (short-subunit alcohol dehydrogenase family)
MDLVGRTVVVTGASRGLGAGMAEWFHDHGAGIGVCARTQPQLRGRRVVSSGVDVTNAAHIAAFTSDVGSELGPIDLWINNAGILDPIAPVRDLDWSDLEAHLRVNLGGVLNGTRAYLTHLAATGRRGALVNISSGLAQRSRAGTGAYAAGKAAVDRLTETIAAEEADLLRIALAVAPGVVETAMQKTIRNQPASVLHDVAMFRRFRDDDMMNTPAWVARHIADWVFGDATPPGIVVRVPDEAS